MTKRTFNTAADFAVGFRPRCVCGCGEYALEGGLCPGHWAMWLRAGRPGDGPGVLHAARDWGLARAKAGQSVRLPRRYKTGFVQRCLIAGCDGKRALHGLCEAHHYRWRSAGKPDVAAFIEAGGGGAIKRRA